jgi:hypothetical protein
LGYIPERLVSKKIAESNTDVIILHDIKLVKNFTKRLELKEFKKIADYYD